jgi:hypothetical protein
MADDSRKKPHPHGDAPTRDQYAYWGRWPHPDEMKRKSKDRLDQQNIANPRMEHQQHLEYVLRTRIYVCQLNTVTSSDYIVTQHQRHNKVKKGTVSNSDHV